MSMPTEAEIRTFMEQQVAFWNDGDRDQMTALYRRYAGNGLTIEYVGHPIGDGWQTYEHIWDNYAGRVKLEPQAILVSGTEGACFIRNVRTATGLVNPSIETYRFGEGTLAVRYFHQSNVA